MYIYRKFAKLQYLLKIRDVFYLHFLVQSISSIAQFVCTFSSNNKFFFSNIDYYCCLLNCATCACCFNSSNNT